MQLWRRRWKRAGAACLQAALLVKQTGRRRKMKDYYKILGVTQQTPTEQIKKANRKLAKQYHPDVVTDDKAKQERMYEIQEAFECLGNEKRRKAYDESLQKASRSFRDPEKKAQDGVRYSEQINPDMSRFERFFGFQAGRGMETCQDNKAKNPEGPINHEEMFAAFFGKMDQKGGRK